MQFQWLIAVTLCSFMLIPFAQAITLEDYLTEVKAKNTGVMGVKKSYEAKDLRKDEATMFWKPSFFLTGEYYDDQRVTNAPSFQGTQTLRHTFRAGITEAFETGTRATLSYNYFNTQINGVNRALIPSNKFIDVQPMIEFTQSLWRNWLGSEFKAAVSAQKAQVDAQRFTDQFAYKQLLMNAENTYWRLYVAQTSLKVQEESLERAKKLRDWNSKRFKDNLIDESDLVQSEANLQSRAIEYQDTVTEIQTAIREFNSFRETQNENVDLEGTKGQDSSYILEATVPTKMKMREDVKAFLANRKLAEANAELGRQRNRPTLELYGQYSINGRDANSFSDAYNQAASATRPFTIYGLRFSTPMDIGAMSDYKKAYAQEVVASDMQFKRKAYEVDREYEILQERFTNFKQRLKLVQKMVQVQEKKLVTEKRRYNQGRTTTFAVLQFEQDFANAQLIKLRFERELIAVYNQLKLFSGVDDEQYQ